VISQGVYLIITFGIHFSLHEQDLNWYGRGELHSDAPWSATLCLIQH